MRLFLIILLFPLKLFSQDLAGVWTGTIYNDTTKAYIPYEIAITENKGKLSGYSHIVFMDNSTEVTGIKTLIIKKKSGKILIEDGELIYNNYIEPPAKGIKKYCVLTLTSGASGEYLIGVFNTNRTKDYASATGTLNLKKKEKVTETKIIPKLDELKLSNSLSFLSPKPEEKKDVAVITPTPKENKSSIELQKDVAIDQPKPKEKEIAVIVPDTKKEVPPSLPKQQKEVAVNSSPVKKGSKPVMIEKDENLIDINEDTIDYKVDVIETDIASAKKQKTEEKKTPPVIEKKTEPIPQLVKQTVVVPETKKPLVVQPKKEVAIAPVKEEKKTLPLPQPKKEVTATVIPKPQNKPEVTPQTNKKETTNPNTTVNKPEVAAVIKDIPKEKVITPVPRIVQNIPPGPMISSEDLAKRKIETIRSVDFKADSLVLTLYDNGVIDGDTVSVILNGKVIMSKARLTEKALSKTIYITPELGDSLQLIMYAENLGSIAPNTGLLIIKDGEDSYQIRFAGDLQKNSAIILRRKRN